MDSWKKFKVKSPINMKIIDIELYFGESNIFEWLSKSRDNVVFVEAEPHK